MSDPLLDLYSAPLNESSTDEDVERNYYVMMLNDALKNEVLTLS